MLHPDSIQITSTYKSVAGLSAAISGSKKNTFVFFRRMEFWLFLVFSLSVPCFPLLTVFTLVDDCEFARCWLFKSGRSPSPGRKCLSFLPPSVETNFFEQPSEPSHVEDKHSKGGGGGRWGRGGGGAGGAGAGGQRPTFLSRHPSYVEDKHGKVSSPCLQRLPLSSYHNSATTSHNPSKVTLLKK